MSPQSTIKALSRASRVSLVGNMAVHETIHTRLFEQPAPTDISPWTRPDQRIWPVYYLSSQMLCQMVQTPQHELQRPVLLTPLGSTTQQGSRPRRFIAVSKDAALSRFTPPPDAVPVTVLLETPTLLRCSIPSLPPETGHDAIRDPKVATFPTGFPLKQDLLADATEVECPSSLYELLQQRNVNILAASDGGQRMTTAPSVG
jgi:hypothetical protein